MNILTTEYKRITEAAKLLNAADRGNVAKAAGVSASLILKVGNGSHTNPSIRVLSALHDAMVALGFLADSIQEHDMTMINEPISAVDTPDSRVSARRECLSPAAAYFSCSTGSGE